jgi:flagellar biosynthesis regulator FlbT
MSNHLSLAYERTDAPAVPARKFFGPRKDRRTATLTRQIYQSIMLMYLDPASRALHYSQFVLRLSEFTRVVRNRPALVACIEVGKDVMEGAYCRALRNCKGLAEFETAERDAGSF